MDWFDFSRLFLRRPAPARQLDVVLGNQNYAQTFINAGEGNFYWPLQLTGPGTGGITLGAALGDLNNDGMLGLVLGQLEQSSVIYINRLMKSARLPNNAPRVALARPGSTDDANFLSTPHIFGASPINIPFTLFDPEGDPLRSIWVEYSPDGGGKWYPAQPVNGSPADRERATCRSPFHWMK